MPRKPVPLALLLCLAGAALAGADDKLSHLLPELYGPRGLIVDSEALLPNGQTHSAHFNSAFQSQFTQFNTALATELTALPLPSPASGFTYEFDPALGVFTRSGRSFGPILADRAETIGRGKLGLGFNFQYFSFDRIEGVDLDSVPAVFTHDNPVAGTGRDDVVTTETSIDTKVGQYSFYLNYGLARWLDVAVAVPVVHTELSLASTATVRRIGTVDPAVHFFEDGQGGFGDTRTFVDSGSATGLGDVIVRLKSRPGHWGGTGLGLGVDVRLPTGDEEDLLGSGAPGVKPFVILSYSSRVVSPHLNLAYQWNGDSLLAGDPVSGTKGDLPDQFQYAAGADIALSDGLTLAADLLGRYVVDSPRLRPRSFQALDGHSTFPDIGFTTESFNELRGAVGFKLNVKGRLLLDVNVLFALDNAGLRDDVTPLFGLEYGF